ncbi:MAG TPA: hypothetical protein VMV39_04705, partial [Terracidiphilus sp.]|nr:hypothetical protein [Terracidiphilus sp.]
MTEAAIGVLSSLVWGKLPASILLKLPHGAGDPFENLGRSLWLTGCIFNPKMTAEKEPQGQSTNKTHTKSNLKTGFDNRFRTGKIDEDERIGDRETHKQENNKHRD